ncbi:MAG: hypothetical protein EZS28_052773 [Streblomastix strix]|uniref:Protein kinase domain-containing protein n=1 Tax=Streblomastix strix TaxID=222440 RepID=A0A5J4RV82_9EUKA|nr:MAG: hypothetical protein EZS28_052773 [Streblomastix strix]
MMRNKAITRPSAIRDNLLWDLLTNLLQFDRKERFSAEQALQHPYFTGPQAQNEICDEAKQIAAQAQLAKQNGDTSITIYDCDSSFVICGNEIKIALKYNPDVDLQPIYLEIEPIKEKSFKYAIQFTFNFAFQFALI